MSCHIAKTDLGDITLIPYVAPMKHPNADIGIAEGKARISLSLPRQLVAELDVEVGRRRMKGEWLSRSEAIDLALASFFESGGLASLDPDAPVPVPPEDRRSTTCHLRHELVAELRRQIIETQVTGWYWAQWEVTSAAIRRFIDAADISPPPESG